QKKYADDVGCPNGALNPFNIDAVINGAYITIGLLYGGGDFGKTVEIATRCGQDSDCNPSNAGGVLGTLLGYEAIPAGWKLGLEKVEELKFSYSDYSLKDIYEVNHRLAGEMVTRGGGTVTDSLWTILTQEPAAGQKVEVAFEGLRPVRKTGLRDIRLEEKAFSTTFSGRGFVVDGSLENNTGRARCEVRVDGKLVESVVLEGDPHNRRTPLFWKYNLADGDHRLDIRMVSGDAAPRLTSLLVYR
ncbi:MAG: ADP-ribosylglycohydrolase family protein, partial [Candidatus Glassbacteria bacterium]